MERDHLMQYKITLKDSSQMTVEGKSYREAMEGTAVPLHEIRNCEEIIDRTDGDSFGATMRGMNGN
jgi:hypothetical protein